jgi:hypothetical protein
MTKIKHTCGDSMYATCVNYDTPLPEFSEITGCADLDLTTAELYSLVGELRDQADLSEIGEKCLEYVEVSGKIFVKNALLKMEEEICLLKEEVETLKTTALCDYSIEACNFSFGDLVDGCNEQPTTLKSVIQILLNQHITP